MTTPELLAFIRNDLSLGNNREAISIKLKSQGWTDEDINEAFTIIGGVALNIARESEVPKIEEKPHTIVSPMHPEIPIETFSSMSSIKPISTMADYKPAPTGKKKVLRVILFIVIPIILVLGGVAAYALGLLFNPKTLATKIINSYSKSTNVLKEDTPITNEKEEIISMDDKEESVPVSTDSDENNLNIVDDNKTVADPASPANEEYKIIEKIELKIKDMASVYFKNHNDKYKGFCRSKNSDGAYQFAIQLPKGTNYKCNDSDDRWASWVKLSTGEYFCVDSIITSFDTIQLNSDTMSCPIR